MNAYITMQTHAENYLSERRRLVLAPFKKALAHIKQGLSTIGLSNINTIREGLTDSGKIF